MSAKKGIFAGILGNVIFGFSYLFTGSALENVRACLIAAGCSENADVPVLLALRSVFALLLMLLLMPIFRLRLHLHGKPVWKLLLLGLCQPVLYFIGETYGLKFTGIVVSSVLISLLPVLSQFFSSLILKERSTVWQALFGMLSVGCVIIVSLLNADGSGKTYFVGILLLLVAVASALSFNLLGRSICDTFTPFERTFAMFAVSAVCFSLIALFATGGNARAMVATLALPHFWIELVYLGGLSSVAAFFLVNYAKTVLPVTRESSFTNVITVVSTASGFIAQPEKGNIPLLAFLCVLIVLGVLGVQLTAPRENKNCKTRGC